MKFYSFHIGDYSRATRHLTNEQDLTYRRLLDLYYDYEQPIDQSTEWLVQRLQVPGETIDYVLTHFFVKQDDGWHNQRCDEEITKFQRISDQNRAKRLKPSGKQRLTADNRGEPQLTGVNRGEPGLTAVNHESGTTVNRGLPPNINTKTTPEHMSGSKPPDVSPGEPGQVGENPPTPAPQTHPPQEDNPGKGSKEPTHPPEDALPRLIIAYLNQVAGRNYQPVPANLKFVRARIEEGATEEQLRRVVDRKVLEWRDDPKMREYLRPETLFGATKFNGYLGQLDLPPLPKGAAHGGRRPNLTEIRQATYERLTGERIGGGPAETVIDGTAEQVDSEDVQDLGGHVRKQALGYVAGK